MIEADQAYHRDYAIAIAATAKLASEPALPAQVMLALTATIPKGWKQMTAASQSILPQPSHVMSTEQCLEALKTLFMPPYSRTTARELGIPLGCRKLRRSSADVATKRAVHHPRRSGRAAPRWGSNVRGYQVQCFR
jgi:hypothetical protein